MRMTAILGLLWLGVFATAEARDLFILSVGVESHDTQSGAHDQYAGDARFVREALQRTESLYVTTHSRVLAGKAATRSAVLDGLDWLVRSADDDDLTIVFFSVHGDGNPKAGYHLNLFETGNEGQPQVLKDVELTAAVKKLKGKAIILVDACRAGGMIPASALTGTKAAFFPGCRPEEETDGQHAFFDRPHGWYVIALCEALDGRADANRDGAVTLGEIETYLPNRAKQWEGGQNAFLIGSDELRNLRLSAPNSVHDPR